MAIYEPSQIFSAANNMDQSETFCKTIATDEFPVLIHPKSATCLLNIVSDHSHSSPCDLLVGLLQCVLCRAALEDIWKLQPIKLHSVVNLKALHDLVLMEPYLPGCLYQSYPV